MVARGIKFSGVVKLGRIMISRDIVDHQPVSLCNLDAAQFDIFIRLVRGESVTDIAKDLHLSVKTVSTHKVTVQKRLGAQSVVDLVRYANEHDLMPVGG